LYSAALELVSAGLEGVEPSVSGGVAHVGETIPARIGRILNIVKETVPVLSVWVIHIESSRVPLATAATLDVTAQISSNLAIIASAVSFGFGSEGIITRQHNLLVV